MKHTFVGIQASDRDVWIVVEQILRTTDIPLPARGPGKVGYGQSRCEREGRGWENRLSAHVVGIANMGVV